MLLVFKGISAPLLLTKYLSATTFDSSTSAATVDKNVGVTGVGRSTIDTTVNKSTSANAVDRIIYAITVLFTEVLFLLLLTGEHVLELMTEVPILFVL